MDKFELLLKTENYLKYYRCNFEHLYWVLEYYDSAKENIKIYKSWDYDDISSRPLQSWYDDYRFLRLLDIGDRNRYILAFSIWYYIKYWAAMSSLLKKDNYYYMLLLAVSIDDILWCMLWSEYSILPERIYAIYPQNKKINLHYNNIDYFENKEVVNYITNLLQEYWLQYKVDYYLYYWKEPELAVENIYIDFVKLWLDNKIDLNNLIEPH